MFIDCILFCITSAVISGNYLLSLTGTKFERRAEQMQSTEIAEYDCFRFRLVPRAVLLVLY
jgi:hypothetical protein